MLKESIAIQAQQTSSGKVDEVVSVVPSPLSPNNMRITSTDGEYQINDCEPFSTWNLPGHETLELCCECRFTNYRKGRMYTRHVSFEKAICRIRGGKFVGI